jgi:hypothetical protein
MPHQQLMILALFVLALLLLYLDGLACYLIFLHGIFDLFRESFENGSSQMK